MEERRRLRILYYVESLDIGGANQSTVTAAVALKRRGHEVFHASLDGPLREKLDAAGIPHFDLDTRVGHPSRAAARQLGEILDREDIDVFCPNGWDCTMDAFLAAAPRGIPVVPTFPGMYVLEYAHPRVPVAIVYSGEYRDALIRRGWNPESLLMLINRIDTDRFRPGLDGGPMRREWGIAPDAPLVLMACRLDTTKIAGVHFLLDAVKPLVERRADVRVVVAGDGDRRAEVAARMADLHREMGRTVVVLAGRVLEMEKAFAAADVVVGNGARSGMEGLACGKPVVSVGPSGVAGVFAPETIEDFAYYNFDKGLVFDGTSRREPAALAGEIDGLLADPERRRSLGEFGCRFSRDHLSIAAGIERLEAILMSARRRSFAERLRDRWEFARSLISFGRHALRRKVRRLSGEAGNRPPGTGGGPPPERSFLRNSTTTFLASLFGLGVGVVQSAIVARILLPEGKGELAAAMMIPQLAATLAPLGINWACTYHLGRRTFDREVLIRSAFTALLFLSAIGVGASLVAGVLLRGSILAGVSRPAFLLALLTLPTSVGILCLSGLFRGEMRIAEANLMDVTRTVLMFLAILLFLVGFRLGAAGVILAQLGAEAAVGTRAFRRFGVRMVPLLRWDVIRNLVGYGVQIYSFSILLYLNYRFDLFLVRRQLDLAQTGLYATAVSLAEMLWMVPNSLGIVLFPSVARASGEERDRLALVVCRNSFWLMLLLCGGMALGRNLALRLFFGAPFVAAGPALLAILPGILAMSIQQVLGSALSGRGRPLPVTLGAAIGFAVNVVLNLLWIPRYGIVGASLASSISYALVAVVVLVAFLKITGRRLREAILLGREDWQRMAGVFGRVREALV